MRNKQKLFFDLDHTLTPSRQPMKPEMAELLPTLNRTIVVVSGSKNEQLRKQVGDLVVISLGQNGNQAISADGKLMWENNLNEEEKAEVFSHINILKPKLLHEIPDEDDLIEDRGSQISFSVYGHNAPPKDKKACDGDFSKRKLLLKNDPFVSDTMEVQMGGSTCLDYFKKGYNKGTNIKRLIRLMGWQEEECVYFGDALFPGGNDDTVNGVIDTVMVKDEDDTVIRLREYFT